MGRRAPRLALGLPSLRHADALYVATAERHRTALLTGDTRIERSRVSVNCEITDVAPADGGRSGS